MRPARCPDVCWFLDAGNNETFRTLREPAFKKRQGTKSRGVRHRLGSGGYGDLMPAPMSRMGGTPSAPTGEARQAGREDTESPSAVHEPERPANTCCIMEEVCERENLKEALRQVRSNKGSAGVDRMTVD